MKIYEKKKVKGEEGEQTELVAVVELELDKDNHVIYTEVTDVITDGKSVTKHNKNEGGCLLSFASLLRSWMWIHTFLNLSHRASKAMAGGQEGGRQG